MQYESSKIEIKRRKIVKLSVEAHLRYLRTTPATHYHLNTPFHSPLHLNHRVRKFQRNNWRINVINFILFADFYRQ